MNKFTNFINCDKTLGKTKQKTFYFLHNWNSQDLNFEHIEVGKQTLPLGYHHIVRR
jgi:transposase